MSRVKRSVLTALLGSLSLVIMLAVGIPILPSASFLKYEPSGVIILIAAVLLGPLGGIAACLVKDFLFLLVGAGNIFGVCSDFANTAVFAATGGIFLRRSSTLKQRMWAYLTAAFASTLVMVPINLVILPLEFGLNTTAVWEMMLPAILPFNFLKAFFNITIFHFISRRLFSLLPSHYWGHISTH